MEFSSHGRALCEISRAPVIELIIQNRTSYISHKQDKATLVPKKTTFIINTIRFLLNAEDIHMYIKQHV